MNVLYFKFKHKLNVKIVKWY